MEYPDNSFTPSPRGLINIGNSCFFNSILQSLASCREFVEFVRFIRKEDDRSFTSILSESLNCIGPTRNLLGHSAKAGHRRSSKMTDSYNPRNLFNHIATSNETFRGSKQQDAEELFQIILASIDKERDLYTHPGVSGISGLIRTTAFEPLRRIYFNSLPLPCKKCPSKIPFEGSLISYLQCADCSFKRSMSHDIFTDLHLPIPELTSSIVCSSNSTSILSVYKFPFRRDLGAGLRPHHGTRQQALTDVSLSDCLKFYLKGEVIESVDCPKCSVIETHKAELLKLNCSESCFDQRAIQRAHIKGSRDEIVLDENSVEKLAAHDQLTTFYSMEVEASVEVEEKENVADDFLQRAAYWHSQIPSADFVTGSLLSVSSSCSFWSGCSKSTSSAARIARQYKIPTKRSERIRARRTVVKTIRLARLPPLLCLHLQRRVPCALTGQMRKVGRHVSFPTQLNMAQFIQGCRGDFDIGTSLGLLYELRAVVVHHGSAYGGHYSAFTSVPNASGVKRWFHVSDEYVRETTETEVLACQAYILFYSSTFHPSRATR